MSSISHSRIASKAFDSHIYSIIHYWAKFSTNSIYGIVKKDEEQSVSSDKFADGSEDEAMRYLFSQVQAFSACLDAFAHGTNDVG